ncbi:MAG: sugar phosphate isomerase/epimerase [Alicyclobacillus sp.]|nr:sugar phosphate isomerase/epimerase [Alicyclobacillus sp.]
MKISLSMWSVHKYWYDGSWDVLDFIDFAATTKAAGVELLSIFWRDKERELPLVEQALRDRGLALACFAACNNLAVSSQEERKAQLQDILDSVDVARRLGAAVVRVFSGDKDPETPFETARGWIIEGLRQAADYALRQGVTLCLENHGYFAGKADQVLDILTEVGSPALRSTFDTGNFLLVSDHPNEAIQKLKPYVGHVHFKDFQPVDENYPGNTYAALDGRRYAGKIAGEGSVDLRYILEQLRTVGYQGWLTVEFEGDEEPKYGSARSIDQLAALLAAL